MAEQVSLVVNGAPIPIDYHFVESYIDLTVGGMLAALKDTEQIKTLNITIEGDKVSINLNNAQVPINDFVSRIFKNTIEGMVSPLKGIGEINKLEINITR